MACPPQWEGSVVSAERKIGMFGCVYLKFPPEINLEYELGGTEVESKGTN